MANENNASPQRQMKRGRNRNSARNAASKVEIFPFAPLDQVGFGSQRAALKYQAGVRRASLHQAAAQARADARVAAQGIRAGARDTIGQVAGAELDRGTYGGSVHQSQVDQVRAQRAAALIENRRGLSQALDAIALERLGAAAELRTGLTGLQAQIGASQRDMSLRAYGSGGQDPWGYGPGSGPASVNVAKQASVVTGGGTQAGGGGNKPISPGSVASIARKAALKSGPDWDYELFWRTEDHDIGDNPHLHFAADRKLRALARKLASLGFSSSRWQARSGTSHHPTGNALDINYRGGGRWNSEAEALDWLERKLMKGLLYGGARQIDTEL